MSTAAAPMPALRDRLLTSAAFRRWAARLPLTRFIARRRASALFDLCAGFVYAQILAACVELRLFDRLAARAERAGDLARTLALPPEGLARLLDAAVALRLLSRRRGGRVGLGPLGAAMVDNPGLVAMVEHHRMLYADLADPVALLRGPFPATRLAGYWPYAGAAHPGDLDGGAVAAYSALMAASQPLIAEQVLDAYPVARHRRLLDVGGGEGVFATEAAARAPGLQLIVFDLPAVAARARMHIARSGFSDRIEVVGGDFLADPLPRGADLVSLVRVVHDHGDAAAARLIAAAHRALVPGGTLLLAEPMARTGGAERVGDAYFGFYLLAMGSGRPRDEAALRRMLQDAGFARIRRLPTAMPMLTGVLVATKGSVSYD